MSVEETRRAETLFKKEQQLREAEKAMADYRAELQATREKTARLRELRLARDAADQQALRPNQKTPRPKQKGHRADDLVRHSPAFHCQPWQEFRLDRQTLGEQTWRAKAARVWLSTRSSVRPASRSSSVSPAHTIGVISCLSTALCFRFTSSSVSPNS